MLVGIPDHAGNGWRLKESETGEDAMMERASSVRAAVIQAAPVLFDREATVVKALSAVAAR
jgi:hypothetical protein